MELEELVIFIVIGGLAGWLAGFFMKGSQGLIGNIIVGVIGSFIGGWLFGVLNLSIGGEWVGPIVTATVGAVVLLFGLGFIKK